MRGNSPILTQRTDRLQPRLRLCDRSGRWRIEPTELARVDDPPTRAVEHHGHQVVFVDFGRIEGRHPGGRRRLPQPVGNPRPLPRPASRALRRRRLTRAFGDQSRDTRRLVKARTPRQASIDHDSHPVDGQAGFGNARREDQLARAAGVAHQRLALHRGVDLPMEPVDDKRQTRRLDRRRCALDVGGAGQKGEHVAFLLIGQRLPHRGEHARFQPILGAAPDMAQIKRPALAFALDHRRIAEQRSEARAVERRRHCDEPQIVTQPLLRIDCEREREIAVEAAFVDFVEQHRRHALQFRIGKNAVAEQTRRHHQKARRRRLLAVEARRIADRPADRFAHFLGNALGRRPRREAPWREQPHRALAPWLAQQGRRDARRLARARRRDDDGVGLQEQRRHDVGQHRVDGQEGPGGRHRRLNRRGRPQRRRLRSAPPWPGCCESPRWHRPRADHNAARAPACRRSCRA